MHDIELAQDLVQDAFANVWASANTPSNEIEFRRYLYRTIANLAYNYRRHQLRAAIHPVMATALVDPLDEIDRRAGDTVMRAALLGLGAREREAIYLRYYEDLSFAETARIMRAPQVTIRVLVHRALAKLRRQLEPNASEGRVAVP